MLEALLFIPIIGSILLFFIKGKSAGYVALALTILTLGINLCMLDGFKAFLNIDTPLQYEINQPWSDSIKSSLHFGIDGLSMLFVLLSNIVVLLAVIYSLGQKDKFNHRLYALMLMMQFGLLGLFTSLDGLLFYVFWEVTLIPIWFICGLWGQENKRIQFTTKFFVYTFAGSLLKLGGGR